MNNFLVITNAYKDKDYELTNLISEYLRTKKCKCTICDGTKYDDESIRKYLYTNPDNVPEDIECAIVLGGDGTLIQASRDLVNRDIPLIGVNFGKLGFLAEVEQNDVISMLDKLIEDNYNIVERMMLEGKIIREEQEYYANIALNDIVISRGHMLRVIDFKVYVNGKLLNLYTADGIIISTPTGSTAYNLSAGGPIARPDSNLIIVTPICPHTLNTRSIVLSDSDEIVIELCQDRSLNGEEKIIAFDGCENELLKANDTIRICKSKCKTHIATLSDVGFLEILQLKMRS